MVFAGGHARPYEETLSKFKSNTHIGTMACSDIE